MGRGDLGDSHVFQGERKGDQSSQADYKRGDYRKLTLKESGGGGHQNTTEPKGVTDKI